MSPNALQLASFISALSCFSMLFSYSCLLLILLSFEFGEAVFDGCSLALQLIFFIASVPQLYVSTGFTIDF